MTNTIDPNAEEALEIATIERLLELGWDGWADCYPETAEDCSISGRESRDQVALPGRLRAALQRLNPGLPAAALDLAMVELTRGRSTMSPAKANREVYDLLKNGVRVQFQAAGPGGEETRIERVRVIDWNRPGENEFFLAGQLWVTGPYHTRRPDVIGFVNGLPLLLVELKKPGVHVHEAYEKNLDDYKEAIPQLFWYNGLVALSNGKDARVGSITAPWDHFGQWKRVEREDEAGRVALETLLAGACRPDRLLDLVENFTVFSEGRGGVQKIVAKNHQYLGVNNALEQVEKIEENEGRLGVFWHTQGSGKSYSMLFFSQKVLRKIRGNWTFVIVTDRRDLDDQIYQVFANAGAVTEPEKTVRAQSGAHLKELLRQDHRYVFTLIHKFHTKPGETYPTLSQRDDIIVITDEAHRSQYDVLARNMRDALPNAAFIGFTGTPLMAEGEELTRQVFGDYVSIYNFKQSIEDEATVALYYENRIPEVQIINEDFDEELERILEEAALDEAQEQRLARQFAREYHIITRDERLERIAADIVQHFMGRGYRGKAMAVSIDKLTAGRMQQKVKRHWGQQLAILHADLEDETDPARRAELADDIAFMAETEMALVVSQGQNEIKQFRERGLDIRPHRKRMNEEPLDEYFKDPAHPLRIVFVCAMWMTGFDVPSCSTIYLDKPMRNHTLMQTIARANRVYGQKNNGLIVDYIGVFRNLQRALAIYATSEGGLEGGERPIKPKAALVEELEEAIGETAEFCAKRGVDMETITSQDAYFKRLEAVEAAADKLLINDQTKDEYLALARWVNRLYKAILPDERANPYRAERDAIKGIADYIQSEIEPPDVSGVMEQVEDLLDRSIGVEGFVIRETADAPFNLSQIDFEALREQFRQGKKRTAAAKLRGKVNVQLQQMVRLNKTRADLAEKFEQMVAAYNEGAMDVDLFFEQLLAFMQQMEAEEQRRLRENLSEEELAIFDLLTKPRPDLTKGERDQVKEVARDMLDTLKAEYLLLDWRKQQQTRAAVKQAIEEGLDALPDAYGIDLYDEKCTAVYTHIYDNYYGADHSIYH